MKTFDIFLIFAQNIDCGYTLEPPRRGGSNEYPQSINKKNRYIPAYPSFAILKWGSRGYTLHGHVFVMKVVQSNQQSSNSLACQEKRTCEAKRTRRERKAKSRFHDTDLLYLQPTVRSRIDIVSHQRGQKT